MIATATAPWPKLVALLAHDTHTQLAYSEKLSLYSLSSSAAGQFIRIFVLAEATTII